jgi:hypothetical protein
MTRSCCPSCRLRFSRATAAQLVACPFCATALQELAPSAVLGFRLIALDALPADIQVAEALAVSLPVPPRGRPELDL